MTDRSSSPPELPPVEGSGDDGRPVFLATVGVLALLTLVVLLVVNDPARDGGAPGSPTPSTVAASIDPTVPATPATPTPRPTPTPEPTPPPVRGTLVAAGDIACDPGSGSYEGGQGTPNACHQRATSELIGDADIVLTTGDNQYEDGLLADYRRVYDQTWGRFLDRTHPVPGNHEYHDRGAAGYFAYFGDRAGDPVSGWYSFDFAGWHFVALNSNCDDIGGCGGSSRQARWLRDDLAANPATCTLAYWHHPRWSSGRYDDDGDYAAFWEALFDAGADIVLNGHDHNYQRYAPLDPSGRRDDARGIRQFVVGTGGKTHYELRPDPVPNREAGNDSTYGVLSLTLYDDRYDWAFVPEAGETYTDAGSGICH